MNTIYPVNWSQLSGFAAFLVIIIQVIWLITLVRVVKNPNVSEIEKFIWVFIVVMLNIIGAILYAFLAPSYSSSKSIELRSLLSGERGMSPAEHERRQRQNQN